MIPITNFKKYPVVLWYFFIATFINKAGALMMPFLSRYLNNNCNFSFVDTGWIFFFLGLGNVCGTYLSGWFIDKFGAYKVILSSLIGSGIILFILAFSLNFQYFCLLIFLFSFISDMLRPAIFITLKSFTNKENRVQSFTLIRTASNLGLILGPLLGSIVFLTNKNDFQNIFYIDAFTCFAAAIIIGILINEKKVSFKLNINSTNIFSEKNAPFKDKIFILNNFVTCICGILFFQFFSIFPLYYSDENFQNFIKVDYLISFLALIVAIFEILVVNYYLKHKFFNNFAIGLGLMFFVFGYFALYMLNNNIGCIIYVVCIGLGAMHTFPFAVSIVSKRSHLKQEGAFMAIFQMSYGFSQMISGKLNLSLVQELGFAFNWKANIFLAIIGIFLNHITYLKLRNEKEELKEKLNSYF